MHLPVRLLRVTGVLAVLLALSSVPAFGESFVQHKLVGASAVTAKARWISGVTDAHPQAFGAWRGTPVSIMGMFGDTDVQAQAQQWQFAHSSFTGDVDLAVGGPVDHTWAQVAAGSDLARWKATAAVLKQNWHYRTVYLRFAHEANGNWMPWSVAPAEVPAYKKAFRLFVSTMRTALKGKNVKIVWAPNFGTWFYQPDTMFPGNDVVDVVGVSTYEWTPYDTPARWTTFVSSSIGPNTWLAFARRHGKPLAFSEWGGQSSNFIRSMHDWMALHAGTGSGQLLYEVYLNDRELVLTGPTQSAYHALRWG